MKRRRSNVSETSPIYFSEVFGVTRAQLTRHGAFNISLIADLPLFIDPFLLFNSRRRVYRQLHDKIIAYLKFLRDKASAAELNPGLIEAWFYFPEVKQTWLGFSKGSNRGHGLGADFAGSLHRNLHHVFHDFGTERVTKGSHLEKLCLIKDGVGRDNISDFTTNLIRGFLAEYTQRFAQRYIARSKRRRVALPKIRFNYKTETWETARFVLPWHNGDYVLLTPTDILTKDDTWINKTDLVEDFDSLPAAVSNSELRAKIDNYFKAQLPRDPNKEPTRKDERSAAAATLLRFPELIDHYIRQKEDTGDKAESVSSERVDFSRTLYVEQITELRALLAQTDFYRLAPGSHEAAHQRIAFLKDVIENKGGHRFFYVKGKPVEREEDLQILYRLTWFGTSFDVSREVNDGRGPADYKISKGARDKTIVEFKLASNRKLKQNLEKQVEVYKKASDAKSGIKVILYFSEEELQKVKTVLKQLDLIGNRDVVLIDGSKDNKPSGSVA